MADQAMALRRCIGSERFGIESHEAPVTDFLKQPSQKDGLGRMCKTHWNEYTAGLARDAKVRKAASAEEGPSAAAEPETASRPEPERSGKRTSAKAAPVAEAQADAD